MVCDHATGEVSDRNLLSQHFDEGVRDRCIPHVKDSVLHCLNTFRTLINVVGHDPQWPVLELVCCAGDGPQNRCSQGVQLSLNPKPLNP